MNSHHLSISSFNTYPTHHQQKQLLLVYKNKNQSQFQCNWNKTSYFQETSISCISSSSSSSVEAKMSLNTPTKLFVSGLSFRTTEESLRNAFKNFGQLVEVNLVMDKIANRPKGFAFVRFATEEESKKAIEGMHGKFLDGRVIFVEVAKPKSDIRRENNK
ncbi:hypothetical protein Leryth_019311 [Lithospermum erythrorhizon]|nr:hypothetical protein Leryth_019311 [Lithospermum erythrorhizon]